MWELVQAPPVESVIVGGPMVEVNTNEAKALHIAKADVVLSKVFLLRKVQVFLYGGKHYIWIAGLTSLYATDDFPVPPKAQAA